MSGDWFDLGGLDGLDGLDALDQVDLASEGHLILDIGGVSYGLPVPHDLGEDAVEDAVTLTGCGWATRSTGGVWRTSRRDGSSRSGRRCA